MSDLRELYQEVLLDHYRRPRNFGPLPGANRTAEGHNPLCGDQLKVYLELAGDRVAQVHFEGSGCAISTASASLMTEAVEGKTIAETEQLFHRFHDMLTGDPSQEAAEDPELGKLAVFAGVREYPVRVKCATLAWHTLRSALEGTGRGVTTE
ncbi:MAG: Fe-S cluster assembly sulfur transfer protein SufU [Acidobacteriota bacterium]